MKLLLRGDANGRVSIFNIPEVTDSHLEQIRQLDSDKPPSMLSSFQYVFNVVQTSFLKRFSFILFFFTFL